ncbi:uncharacterized protein LOC110713338 [Chenopodium quinoa]|uniref:Uncharacterized protein n=1 Tax=Chenopodium quinoa TaxID=63459 RepID=A0A803MR09_CHEQI|nr:uncharacterized protein LOC110713338 [Chenopodium quinoa]
MASTYNVFPPGLLFHQQQPNSRPFKDFPHLPTTGSRHDALRSSIISLTPYEHDDLFKSMSGLDGYSQFVRAAPIRRMSMPGDAQDKQADYDLFNLEEQWKMHKELLPFVMPVSNELEKNYLDSSIYPDFKIQATNADMHLLHLANFDPVRNLSSSTVSVLADGRISAVGSVTDMKDLVSVIEEFRYTKESAWRKQEVVPYFRWNGAGKLQDRTYMSPSKLNSLTVAPSKSLEKVKQKPSSKRKSKRAAIPNKINSLQACEMLLSIIVDKKRNGKSVTSSVKKAGPALPLLLTQVSASITGTGLAVMFSVIHKVACGSIPFCTSNLLTSGFGVGLFWLSWAVNTLRNTIIYIGKNSTKLESEEEMMVRMNKSVNDIFFRAVALMAVLILRFA